MRLLLLLAVLLGACSPTPQGDDAGTRVQRTKVSTSTGGALDAAPVQEAPPAEEDPNAPCKHVWEHVRQGTHAWVDETGDVPIVSLCTPIVCTKCGAVRHECARALSRGR